MGGRTISLALYHARMVHPSSWYAAVVFLIVMPELTSSFANDSRDYFIADGQFFMWLTFRCTLLLMFVISEEASQKQMVTAASLAFPLTRAIAKRHLFRARLVLAAAILSFPTVISLTGGFAHPNLELKAAFVSTEPIEDLRLTVAKNDRNSGQKRQLRYLERLPQASLRHLKTKAQRRQMYRIPNVARSINGTLHIENGHRDKMLAVVLFTLAGASLMILWCLACTNRFPGQNGIWIALLSPLAIFAIYHFVVPVFVVGPVHLAERTLIEFMRAPWIGSVLSLAVTFAALFAAEKLWIRKEAA
jgi:hypothetical protein